LAVLEIEGSRLTYRLTVVASEQDEQNQQLLEDAANGDAVAAERVADAMRQAVHFAWGGELCVPGRIRFQGSRTADSKVVLEMALSCPRAVGRLLVRDDWSLVLGGHFQTVMSVRPAGHRSSELIFNPERREAEIDPGDSHTSWVDFIVMGAEHILSGP